MENHNDIAIIGLSCMLPAANSLQELHQVLSEGRDMVRNLENERIYHSCLKTRDPYQVSAHLSRVDTFDYPYFKISRKEAEAMDPNQRLVLELTVTAMENAGYPVSYFRGKEVAVYLAAKAHSKYYDQLDDKDFNAFIGNLQTMLAGRVAHKLDLRGPAITLDTACSAGLVAVHEAISKLLLKEVDYAIAGGINIESDFFELEADAPAGLGIHSTEGKSRPFDDSAEGIGGGEGGGIVLLKRLADAETDGDVIHAVIRGSAVNQDGYSSNGITAPSPDAQTKVLTTAWKRANLPPETITYIEAHGTGTKLGDPIEFSALNEAFKQHTDKESFCAISALKSNYGHLNNAAGIAGLLKAIAALKYKSLYPTVHFKQLNSHIASENAAVYVNDTFKHWESDTPRRCGVSSFGLSGTNVHMVLEESRQNVVETDAEVPVLLKASAKSPAALINYLEVLRNAIPTATELPLFLGTLNQGRGDYAFRAAFAAKNGVQLQEKIAGYLTDAKSNTATSSTSSAVVLLLANGGIAEEKVIDSYLTYPAFRETYEEVLGLGDRTEEVQVLAFQLAFISMLKSIGVELLAIIGFGIGKLAKSVVVDHLPLESALNSLGDVERVLKEENRDKLQEAITRLQSDQAVVFVELSDSYELSAGMADHVIKKKIYGSHLAEELIAEMYVSGSNIDWKSYYEGLSLTGSKVEAPTYPFEKIACGIKNPLLHYGESVKEWHHQLVWEERALAVENIDKLNGPYLWIAPNGACAIPEAVSSDSFLLVRHAEEEASRDIKGFSADFSRKASVSKLRDDLESSGIQLKGIIFDALTTEQSPDSKEGQMEMMMKLFNTAVVFQSHLSISKFLLAVITGNSLTTVKKATSLTRGFDNMISTFVKSLLVDFPKARMLSLDFETPIDAQRFDKAITEEILAGDEQYFIQYANGKRHVQRLVRDPDIASVSAINARSYLITGGAGGIGLEMACMLSLQPNTKEIVLLGRSDWAHLLEKPAIDALSPKEKQLYDQFTFIQDKGVRLKYFAADVADKAQLEIVVDQIEHIDVVVHCAGLSYEAKPLADKMWDDITRCLAPKVDGTINLIALSKSLNADKILLFSSLNALIPKPQSLEYALSNAFLDAYANNLNAEGLNVTSINWPGWRAVGMGGQRLIKDPGALQDIHVIEGFASMSMAMASNQANTIVANFSKKELGQNPFFLLEVEEEQREELPELTNEPGVSDADKSVAEIIEGIWCEVLKMDGVEHDVDFFEIGGHSLNGTQVINRIEERLGVELDLEDLFDYGDISSFANLVEERLEEQEGTLVS